MAITTSTTWEDIELSETHLLHSNFQQAFSLASSILNRLRQNATTKEEEEEEASQVYDMLESAGMVLVQSLKGLGRNSEIIDQLRLCFLSVKFIPFQVFLTGVSLQITHGSPLVVREFIEEFLDGWVTEGEQYCSVVESVEIVLGIDKYVDIVEVYVVTLLGTVLNDVEGAISWVENAQLPENKRQEILRRLHSMQSLKSTNMARISRVQPVANDNEACSVGESVSCEEGKVQGIRKFGSKGAIVKLSKRIEPCFWCFRSINLKIGNFQFVLTKGKVLLGCVILLVCYVLRKKQVSVRRAVGRQLVSVKRALVDIWQLAFSYQVNPLAAVQPLPTATRGG